MKHVFVDAGFLVDLLRPFPSKGASALLARNDGVNLCLHIPWCAELQATRTLRDRVIDEDLGFTDAMMKFTIRRFLSNNSAVREGEVEGVQRVRDRADAERLSALASLEQRIQEALSLLTQIQLPPPVVVDALRLVMFELLEPLEEIAVASILWKATELYADGERDLHFCSVDAAASEHPAMVAESSSCGLAIRHDFRIP